MRTAREVDLLSYLPPFLAEFKEMVVVLEAENPEFALLWETIDRVLQNEFIESADEYGISRFEKILNITPSLKDTLENRRFRVLVRFNESIPYTLPKLKEMLQTLCGEGNCSAEVEAGSYHLIVKIGLAAKGNFADVASLLERVVPQNMLVTLTQLYNTHVQFVPYTHTQLDAYTHDTLRNEVLS